MFLFDSADKERYEDHRFLAAVNGIDIEENKEQKQGENHGSTHSIDTQKDPFAFQDPKDYEHLTEEERKTKTNKMLKHWKQFSLNNSPKKS